MTESSTERRPFILCTYGEANDELDDCRDGTDVLPITGIDDSELIHGERMWRVGAPGSVGEDGRPLEFLPVCSVHLPWLLATLYAEGEGPQLVVPLEGLEKDHTNG